MMGWEEKKRAAFLNMVVANPKYACYFFAYLI